jgi:hypothetical protein
MASGPAEPPGSTAAATVESQLLRSRKRLRVPFGGIGECLAARDMAAMNRIDDGYVYGDMTGELGDGFTDRCSSWRDG